MPHFADESFHVLLRITVDKFIFFRAGLVEVCIRSQLLLPQIATYGPNLIIIAGTGELLLAIVEQLSLPSPNHALYRVHGYQVVPTTSTPLVRVHQTILENLLHFQVRFEVQLE
jgi:hypothetical protein